MKTNKYEGLRFDRVINMPDGEKNSLIEIENDNCYALVCPLSIKRIAVVRKEVTTDAYGNQLESSKRRLLGFFVNVKKRSQDEHPTLHYDGDFDMQLTGAMQESFNDWERMTVEFAFKAICPIKHDLT